MKIESYAFGSMAIDGRVYRSDLMIMPDGRVMDNWWRKTSHLLIRDDIASLIQAAPKVIIAGTGANGLMAIDPALSRDLAKSRIELAALPSEKAAALFNETWQPDGSVGACFHLTC